MIDRKGYAPERCGEALRQNTWGWRSARMLLALAALLVIASCGAERSAATLEAQPPTSGPATPAPAPSPTAAPPATLPPATQTPPAPSSTPAATIAQPSATVPAATVEADDPFKYLTALALTPTVPPEPLTPPEKLTIPKIGLDVPVLPVGLDAQGNAVVLKHDVAWFDRSGRPGEGTNVAFWAHVLRFADAPDIPAPFARVAELIPGDRVVVTSAAGKQFNYAVTHQVRVQPEQADYLDPTPVERLVLISCIGENVMVNGELTKTQRLVTIAEPIR